MDLVISKGKDFIVLINKSDTLGPELDRRFADFRANYARVLRVPEVSLV
jgi:hypothetical protein